MTAIFDTDEFRIIGFYKAKVPEQVCWTVGRLVSYDREANATRAVLTDFCSPLAPADTSAHSQFSGNKLVRCCLSCAVLRHSAHYQSPKEGKFPLRGGFARRISYRGGSVFWLWGRGARPVSCIVNPVVSVPCSGSSL
jgi:hypothetical protein